MGTWWHKNDNYSYDDIVNLVNSFNNDNIPMSLFLLGDYWHDNNNHYIPNIDLKGISSYLNSKNIKLGLTINPNLEIKNGSNEFNVINNYIPSDKLKFIPFSNEKIGVYFNLIINNLESQGVNVFSIDYNNILDKMNLWKLNHYHYGKNELGNSRGLILSRNSFFNGWYDQSGINNTF